MLSLFAKKPETIDPELFYSSILRRRLDHWKNHNKIKNRAVREEIERLRHYNEKRNAYEFARSHGISCPNYTEYPSIADALQDNAHNPRFVVKPAAGHSANGVFLLTRNDDGSLNCHMNKQQFKNDEELARTYTEQKKLRPKYAMSKEVIIEEYVEDAQGHVVPIDYKIYAFKTGVHMIMQKHGPLYLQECDWVLNFYDGDGKRLERVREEPGERTRNISPPASFKELVDTANKLVKAMNVSFIRIDLFQTKNGIYFGECTPLPNLGRKSFYDEYEAMLGSHWMKSLKALGMDYANN